MNVMTKQGSLDNQVTYEHYCDTQDDLINIPQDQISLGSTAIVIKDSNNNNEINVYIANFDKQWIPMLNNSGNNNNQNINISPITITSNGTYTAAENEAYSPIIVNVNNSEVQNDPRVSIELYNNNFYGDFYGFDPDGGEDEDGIVQHNIRVLTIRDFQDIRGKALENCQDMGAFIVFDCLNIHNRLGSYAPKYIYLDNSIEYIDSNAFNFDVNTDFVIDCGFSENSVPHAPWGATEATINYNISEPRTEQFLTN